jgi:hypothetical protein
MIQCARVAFGFAGIYDPDEAERIRETSVASVQLSERPRSATAALNHFSGGALPEPDRPVDSDEEGEFEEVENE